MSFDKLTPQARIKFNELNDEAEETRARLSVIQSRINGMMELADIAPPADLDRQRQRMADEQTRFTYLMRVTTSLRTWIMQIPARAEVLNVKAPDLKLEGTESLFDRVADLRNKIRETQSDIVRTFRAVLPLTELLKQADLFVESVAARGKPTIRTDNDNLSLKWDTGALHDAVHMIAWLDPAVLKKKLHAEIEKSRQPTDVVLTIEERKAKISALEKQKLEYERQEECFIEMGALNNTHIPRREDASPAAILGLEIVRRNAAAA